MQHAFAYVINQLWKRLLLPSPKAPFQPNFPLTFNSVRSSDIRPRFRPENRAENIRHTTMMRIDSQSGIIRS